MKWDDPEGGPETHDVSRTRPGDDDVYGLGLPPTQYCNSHHQDFFTFLGRESQPKPSFATGILGGG